MNSLHNISAYLLAALLLVSTSSFAVNIHYCDKELAGFSFDDSAMICDMENMEVKEHKSCDLHKDNCCHTKQVVVNGQDELQPAKKSLASHQQIVVAAFVMTYHNLFFNLEKQITPFKNYIPPLLVKDIHVMDETFLI